jgi:glutamine amidotransferase-like uncharacterized protein
MMKVFIFTTNEKNAVYFKTILEGKAEYVVTKDMLSLDSTYDLVIIPGGTAKNYLNVMGDEGVRTLKQYINDGGGYFGVCAGAYIGAVNDATLRKNVGIGLLPVYYTLYKRNIDIQCTVKLHDITENNNYTCRYHNGAVFESVDVGENVTSYAKIIDVDNNQKIKHYLISKTAIVAGMYGQGQVVLCGPHIEAMQPDYTLRFMLMAARK